MATWQIQAKAKTGYHWEPISVEPVHRSGHDQPAERKYEYNDLAEAAAALARFLDSEKTFPAIITHLATGGQPFLSVYDVRFGGIVGLTDAYRVPELRRFFEEPKP
jgi:hypothetical protein